MVVQPGQVILSIRAQVAAVVVRQQMGQMGPPGMWAVTAVSVFRRCGRRTSMALAVVAALAGVVRVVAAVSLGAYRVAVVVVRLSVVDRLRVSPLRQTRALAVVALVATVALQRVV
jgi:hypothetical protein